MTLEHIVQVGQKASWYLSLIFVYFVHVNLSSVHTTIKLGITEYGILNKATFELQPSIYDYKLSVRRGWEQVEGD